MAAKEKKKKEKYNFVQVFVCEKCEKENSEPEPCKECQGEMFDVKVRIQEIK